MEKIKLALGKFKGKVPDLLAKMKVPEWVRMPDFLKGSFLSIS
jgi:hypothetical protein